MRGLLKAENQRRGIELPDSTCVMKKCPFERNNEIIIC